MEGWKIGRWEDLFHPSNLPTASQVLPRFASGAFNCRFLVFGVVLFAGANTLYVLCVKTKRRNFRYISQHFAQDPGKKTSNRIIS